MQRIDSSSSPATHKITNVSPNIWQCYNRNIVSIGLALWVDGLKTRNPPYTFTPILNKPNQIGVSKDHLSNGQAQVDRIYGNFGDSGLGS